MIIVAGGIWAFRDYRATRAAEIEAEDRAIAEVVSQVWLAGAEFRNNPERFLQFRDSLMESAGLTKTKLLDYVTRVDDPGRRAEFVTVLSQAIDSLVELQLADSLSDSPLPVDTLAGGQ